MKITVMIPTYFSADVIGYCISSVVEQVDRVIVVDGIFTGSWAMYTGMTEGKKVESNYSTDDTEKICNSFGNKVSFHRCIGPPGSKLNEFLSLVPHDCHWILEMDADEVMNDGGVVRLKEFLQTNLGRTYGNFALRYYHIIDDFEHEIDTSKAQKLGHETGIIFCYVSRLHYYELGFRFDGINSEIVRDEREGSTIYKPASSDKACYGGSYPIPVDICKLLHIRFFRKNAFHVQRILGDYFDEELKKRFVMLSYSQHIVEFPVRDFQLKEEFSVLYK